MLYLYRMLVMYRQPFIPTESGYHVPSTEEVIAGIRAYFDPAHRIGDSAPAAVDEDSYSEGVRALLSEDIYTRVNAYFDPANRGIDSAGSGDQAHVHQVQVGPSRPVNEYEIKMLRTLHFPVTALPILKNITHLDTFFNECLSHFVQLYSLDWSRRLDSGPTVDLTALIENGFSIPPPAYYLAPMMLDFISRFKASKEPREGGHHPTSGDLKLMSLWFLILRVLERPDAAQVSDCPFFFFFFRYCLDQGLALPRLALDAYDRMKLQLSREFIRCANPSCKLSKLDQSTGKVTFKKCSRCRAVIYCSRECQTAHYPEHKKLCREHA